MEGIPDVTTGRRPRATLSPFPAVASLVSEARKWASSRRATAAILTSSFMKDAEERSRSADRTFLDGLKAATAALSVTGGTVSEGRSFATGPDSR